MAPIAGPKPHTGETLINGKLSNNNYSKNSPAQKFVAAKPLIKKAVFCVDNVDNSDLTEDIRAFVTEMSVNVVSRFETKPRRRRFESTIPRSVIIKLSDCVSLVDDRERFLDANKWPTYVTVCDWLFKATLNSSGPLSDHRFAVQHVQGGDGANQNDMDQTVMVADQKEYTCDKNSLNSNCTTNGV